MKKELWTLVLQKCGVRQALAVEWAPHFEAEIQQTSFSAGIVRELPDFLSQVLHESSMLGRMVEDLNYTTPQRLMAVWPSRFKSVADAQPFCRNPKLLAEKVYGGRMGNKTPGDGFKYRGGGLIMVTGRDNYTTLQKVTGLPLVENPDLIRVPGKEALRVCLAWWEGHVPDGVMGNVVRVTKAVNGGSIGIDDRTRLYGLAKASLAPFLY